MLAEQHSQGSPLSKVVEYNFGTTNGIEQNGLLLHEKGFPDILSGGLGSEVISSLQQVGIAQQMTSGFLPHF